MRESRYVLAGSPTCCQRCSHPFEEICIRPLQVTKLQRY
jgi:hypothetical protein